MDRPERQEISAFPVDNAVMSRIRPMQARDADAVAALHQAAMGKSLWARLGPTFLATIYRALVDSPHFLGFVYEEQGRVRGFIAGSTDTPRMFREILAKRAFRLGLVTSVGLLRNPSALPLLLRTATYFERSGEDIPGESLFCSFEPDLRGKRVSGHINKVLFDELLARGHHRVKITSEADNEGSARQLGSWGFTVDKRFHFYGKEMLRYVLDLKASPRVEPVSRHPAV